MTRTKRTKRSWEAPEVAAPGTTTVCYAKFDASSLDFFVIIVFILPGPLQCLRYLMDSQLIESIPILLLHNYSIS